jgi:hypothetical protein
MLYRRAINKTIATRKAIIAKMRGEVLTLKLTAENFVTINLNHCLPEHVAFINTLFGTQFDYIPKQYPGRVLVYAAKTQQLGRLRHVVAAWRKVAPASEIVKVSGTHVTIMRRPDGYAAAKHLAKRIAELSQVST